MRARYAGGGKGLQLLEVTVCDVVAAPVRNSVELDAVRELHLILCLKPEALRLTVLVAVLLSFLLGKPIGIVEKLDGVGVGRTCSWDPSSLAIASSGYVAAGWW